MVKQKGSFFVQCLNCGESRIVNDLFNEDGRNSLDLLSLEKENTSMPFIKIKCNSCKNEIFSMYGA